MKVGLALGSGAARGWAHIGIIQALEALGVEIEVVSGCSIGAYVGAAYCSGKLPELAEWSSGLTEWQVLSMLGVGLHKGGLVSGQKVFQALQDQFSVAEFEQLDKPLGIVATDLYSGKEITFTEGEIVRAVRASCAIPGFFPPVKYQNRWLVDGAVVNPVPVNLCNRLGSDFTIAVNLGADFRPQAKEQNKKGHEINQQKTNDFFAKSQEMMQQWFKGGEDKENRDNSPSVIGVMSTSMDIMQARLTRSRLAGDPPDLVIEPQLGNFGGTEYYQAKAMIEEGKQSVARLSEQIRYMLKLS